MPFRISVKRHRELIEACKLEIILGDSITELQKLLVNVIPKEDSLILYLDAHWFGDIPTVGEVQVLQKRGRKWIAIVDDFEVPGEHSSEYGFDVYCGKKVNTEMFENYFGFSVYCTNEPGSKETGFRRGTGYLISDEARKQISPKVFRELGLTQVV